MTKVIVTGATGFLGFNLAKRLHSLGYEVIGLGRNISKGQMLEQLGIKFKQVDLDDLKKLTELCKNTEFVFHCAAKSSVWGSYKTFYKANVVGTKNVVEACQKNNIKRLIYVSSPSIYFDFMDKLDIPETEKPTSNPANNYIKTKILAEKIVDKAHNEGLEVITIRPRGIFGSGDTALLPRLIKANNKKFIPRTTKNDILIDITHVENVVESLILAMNAPKNCCGEKYNITNDESVYFYQTIEKLIIELNMTYKSKYINYSAMNFIATLLEFIYKFIPNKEPLFTRYSVGLLNFNQTLDITKAKKELGYKPIISIEEGLKNVANNYLKGKDE